MNKDLITLIKNTITALSSGSLAPGLDKTAVVEPPPMLFRSRKRPFVVLYFLKGMSE